MRGDDGRDGAEVEEKVRFGGEKQVQGWAEGRVQAWMAADELLDGRKNAVSGRRLVGKAGRKNRCKGSVSQSHTSYLTLSPSLFFPPSTPLPNSRRGDVTFGKMDVNRMSFPNRTFDTVCDTFGLCSFEDPQQALQEMERVCKDEGEILLLEHGRSHYDWLNAILDKNSHRHTARWGCVWNRDIEKMVLEAGLEVKSMTRWHFGTTYMIHAKPGKREGDRRRRVEGGEGKRKGWWAWLNGGRQTATK